MSGGECPEPYTAPALIINPSPTRFGLATIASRLNFIILGLLRYRPYSSS